MYLILLLPSSPLLAFSVRPPSAARWLCPSSTLFLRRFRRATGVVDAPAPRAKGWSFRALLNIIRTFKMSAKPSEKIKNEKRPGKKAGRREGAGGLALELTERIIKAPATFIILLLVPTSLPYTAPVPRTDALGSQIYLADPPPPPSVPSTRHRRRRRPRG